MESPILFATRSYSALGTRVAEAGGFQRGTVDSGVWPDGEIHQEIRSPVAGRDIHLVAGTANETDTLEAFDLASALISQGARSLTLVIPFFGYSTMERSSRAGAAIIAKSRARLWSALPRAPSGNRILILEPHTIGLTFYFEGGNLVSGLDAAGLMKDMLEGLLGEDSMLCSPDIGRIKWVDRLAGVLGLPSAFVLKRRMREGGVQTFGLTGDVKGRDVILCDDMIRTGGTLIQAAGSCLAAGARSVSAATIHGAFSPGSLEALRDSGLIRALRCSDSHPRAFSGWPGWPEVATCAGLLARAMAPP